MARRGDPRLRPVGVLEEEDAEEESYISRGRVRREKKAETEALVTLGTELASLAAKHLDGIPLTPDLRRAVDQARTMKHDEARRRLLRRVGKLLRAADHERIKSAVDGILRDDGYASGRALEWQQWRTRLLDDGDAALNELVAAFPTADRNRLRRLARNARRGRDAEAKKAAAAGKPTPPDSAQERELLAALKELDQLEAQREFAEELERDELEELAGEEP